MTEPYILDTPTPERFPCSHAGCGEPSSLVEAIPFTRNGMESSIGFYGRCAKHPPPTCHTCGVTLPGAQPKRRYCDEHACGTYSGWNRHQKAGQTPCDDCKHAAAVYQREWRGKNRGKQALLEAKQHARDRALRRLAREYPARLLELHDEELAKVSAR